MDTLFSGMIAGLQPQDPQQMGASLWIEHDGHADIERMRVIDAGNAHRCYSAVARSIPSVAMLARSRICSGVIT